MKPFIKQFFPSSCNLLVPHRAKCPQHPVLIYLKPFKADWYLYAPATLTISNSAFCVYGFHMILSVNRDYLLKQH
jgi:hypothetical protein